MISAGHIKHTYNGNGTTRNWDYTFPIYTIDGADIKLYKTAINGLLTEITANYYVDVENKWVVYPTEVSELPLLVEGEKITLIRIETLSQDADWRNQGPFNAETVEAVCDKNVMIAQQLDEEMSRIFKYSADQALTQSEMNAFMINVVNLGDISLAVDQAEAAAVAAANYAAALKDASTTTNTIGTGEKTFTISTGKQFAAGQFILILDAANSANYMHGQIVSYTGTTLVVDVTNTGGSGTKSDWKLYVSGTRGTQGPMGPTSPIPIAVATGTANAILADYDPDISLADKTLVAFVAIYANSSTTPTFSPDGLPSHSIVKRGGQPLSPSDIAGAGFVALIEYNLANTRWELINAPALKVKASVADPTAGYLDAKINTDELAIADYLLKAKDGGKILKKQVFTSNGTFIAPVGVTTAYITACAGGGGGAVGGGGAGETCIKKPYIVTPEASYTVTIGAAGVGGVTPTNGGNTVFGSIMTLTGGYKGVSIVGGLAGRSIDGTDAVTFTPGVGGGGCQGDGGDGATYYTNYYGGGGGGNPFGIGGDGKGGNNNGENGKGYSSGGGGGPGGKGGYYGGNGAPGFMLIEW